MLSSEKLAVRDEVRAKLFEKGIELVTMGKVLAIKEDCVQLEDGRVLECNVAIWATGAEPQNVCADSQ